MQYTEHMTGPSIEITIDTHRVLCEQLPTSLIRKRKTLPTLARLEHLAGMQPSSSVRFKRIPSLNLFDAPYRDGCKSFGTSRLLAVSTIA